MRSELIITVLTSAALVGFIQFLITRHDSKNGILEWIKKEIETIKKEIRFDKADRSRRHILEASDDVRNNHTHHSEEWWEQLIIDIDYYEKFCQDNEEQYVNNRAVMAIENLKRIYKELLTTGFD